MNKDKNPFVAIGVSLGGIFIGIVALFVIFASESIGILANIVWGFVILGIILGFLAYKSETSNKRR